MVISADRARPARKIGRDSKATNDRCVAMYISERMTTVQRDGCVRFTNDL